MKKVMFISSCGGHLAEMLRLNKMFNTYDYHIITEKTNTTNFLTEKYEGKVNYLVYGTKDYIFTYPFKLVINCFKSLYFYLKIRPDYIISTGAHTAGPMCLIGKIFGTKVIYIETFANLKSKTITGKLLYPFADLFIVQWSSMQKLYKKSVFGGWIY